MNWTLSSNLSQGKAHFNFKKATSLWWVQRKSILPSWTVDISFNSISCRQQSWESFFVDTENGSLSVNVGHSHLQFRWINGLDVQRIWRFEFDLALLLSPTNHFTSGHHHWPKHYPTCGGGQQSPIDIQMEDTVCYLYPPLFFSNYYQVPMMSFLENGHTGMFHARGRSLKKPSYTPPKKSEKSEINPKNC